jgi:predicted AAA+ superfamily ATPase
MNIHEINKALASGDVERTGVLPKLDILARQSIVFHADIGLDVLPEEPGILLIRGPRQYGKSTWLQQHIKETVKRFGPGSAYYINGDEIRNDQALEEEIDALRSLFSATASVKRLFIDEITAVKGWEKVLKRLVDANVLEHVLVVTTGSKAADLRHGAERLPGRKGRLSRTQYLFTPLSFSEFVRQSEEKLADEDLVPAYLITGGSPPAAVCLLERGVIEPFIIELVRDWIYGEFAASGRSRAMLLGVLECLYRFGCTPVGQSKLAREAGLANNTVAAGYIDLLEDLMCCASSFAWDASRQRINRRKPCKFHLINLLAAIAWHPQHLRSPSDFRNLAATQQAVLLEWLVAQECWRRRAVRGDEMPEIMSFWASDQYELDFVLDADHFIEVKRGRAGPLDFGWFARCFPKSRLTVISNARFETEQIKGVTFHDFMMDGAF